MQFLLHLSPSVPARCPSLLPIAGTDALWTSAWNRAEAEIHACRASAPVSTRRLSRGQRLTITRIVDSAPSPNLAVDLEQGPPTPELPETLRSATSRPRHHAEGATPRPSVHRAPADPSAKSRQSLPLRTSATVSVSPSANPLKRYRRCSRLSIADGEDDEPSSAKERASGGAPRNHLVPKLKTRFATHRRLILARNQIHVRHPGRHQTWMGIITPHSRSPLPAPLGSNSARRVRELSRVLWWSMTPR
jgi:hypothetical protein